MCCVCTPIGWKCARIRSLFAHVHLGLSYMMEQMPSLYLPASSMQRVKSDVEVDAAGLVVRNRFGASHADRFGVLLTGDTFIMPSAKKSVFVDYGKDAVHRML